MKSQLIAIVAAVLVVGCGPSVPDISICEAARFGDIKAVKQHLAAGTDVNAKNNLPGLTPLHQAASSRNKEIAKLLIAAGADVNAKSVIDYTPLDHTIGHDENEIADLLRKHGGKHGTIHTAAKAGDAEAVKEFLAAGADVNVKGGSEWTPLHEATRGGRKGIVKLLIAKGADVNAKDWRGTTPLDFAIIKRQSEIANLLRKHGGKTAEELKAEGK